jgi:hypothetical protein
VTAVPASNTPTMIINGNRFVHFGKIADICLSHPIHVRYPS